MLASPTMIFLLLSLYFSRVSSAPLSSFLFAPILAEDDITGVEATRTLWNVVYTCFTTTFAITWISMHPNIPNSNKTYYPTLLRLLLACYALLIPEAIVFWAAVQWKSAHQITVELGNQYKHWTITHGFFLVMGGFAYSDEKVENPKHIRILPAHEFMEMLRDGRIDCPTVIVEDLKDKSKGDPLAKGIVILQTLWFIIQILARFAQHLVVTELEVIVFALVPLNVVTYYFWMHKPLGVKRPIILYPSERELKARAADGNLPPNSPILEEGGWLDRTLQKFITWVEIWAQQADKMTSTHHPDPSAQQGEAPTPNNNPSNTRQGARGKIVSFQPVVKLARFLAKVAEKFRDFRNRANPQLTAETEQPSDGVGLLMKSIIGGIFAIIVVIFLAVFAILSAPPLLFVGLGFLCLAILTAPLVATSAFHDIGTKPVTDYTDPYLAIFYAPQMDNKSFDIMLSITVFCATVFGGLHILAWNSAFPTRTEHRLWRISSVTLAGLPAVYLLYHFLNTKILNRENETSINKKIYKLVRFVVRGLVLVGIIAYTLARLFVLAAAVASLRNPGSGTLKAVTWSKFIPHF